MANGSGFDRNGFFDCDLADDDPVVLFYKRSSSSGAPAADSGTSRGTSDPAFGPGSGSSSGSDLTSASARRRGFLGQCC